VFLKKFRMLAFLVAVSASLSVTWAQSHASPQNIDAKVFTDLSTKGNVSFFVVMKEQADTSSAAGIADWGTRGERVVDTLQEAANRTQKPILARLSERGAAVKSFWIVNTIKVTTKDERLIRELAARADVDSIKADAAWQIPSPLPGAEEPTVQNVEWGVARVHAPDVWDQFVVRGEGIIVATIDTGVQYTHPALVGQYRGLQKDGSFDHNYNWFDPSNACPPGTPCDTGSHGTHTMGTIIGDDGVTNQIGVAPGAQWIEAAGCPRGSCPLAALLASGQWMLAPTDLNGENPRPDLRPNIVSNSWADGTSDPFYRSTVQSWRDAGVFPVFANGNPGSGCGLAQVPAAYPESLGVGAIDINDNIAGFSARGPANAFGETKPNVSAPGVNVRSSIPTDRYGGMSGTSMATPHVAGVVALLWSAIPGLVGDISTTFDLVETTTFFRSSTQCGDAGPPNNVYGWGIVDALAAVQQGMSSPNLQARVPVVPSIGALLTGSPVRTGDANRPESDQR